MTGPNKRTGDNERYTMVVNSHMPSTKKKTYFATSKMSLLCLDLSPLRKQIISGYTRVVMDEKQIVFVCSYAVTVCSGIVFTCGNAVSDIGRIMRALTSTTPAWNNTVSTQCYVTLNHQYPSTTAFTCSISHIGVEVAPHTPTVSPGLKFWGFSSEGSETK